jgi:hypothetical protein
LLYLGFDPDGTVGTIKWEKWGGEFSAEEIGRGTQFPSIMSTKTLGWSANRRVKLFLTPSKIIPGRVDGSSLSQLGARREAIQ